jgi:hypothetical protein
VGASAPTSHLLNWAVDLLVLLGLLLLHPVSCIGDRPSGPLGASAPTPRLLHWAVDLLTIYKNEASVSLSSGAALYHLQENSINRQLVLHSASSITLSPAHRSLSSLRMHLTNLNLLQLSIATNQHTNNIRSCPRRKRCHHPLQVRPRYPRS